MTDENVETSIAIYNDLTTKASNDAIAAIIRALDLLPSGKTIRAYAVLTSSIDVAYPMIGTSLSSLADRPIDREHIPTETAQAVGALLHACTTANTSWGNRFVNAQRIHTLVHGRRSVILDDIITITSKMVAEK